MEVDGSACACDRFADCTRRAFMQAAGCALASAALSGRASDMPPEQGPVEARFYEKLGNGSVQCGLCPWACVVPQGGRGRCRVRENRAGRFHSLVYGRPVALNNDPIEKKPLFHVFPGSRAFSIATVGCNLECKFCQNWDIAQASPQDVKPPFRSPGQIVDAAAEGGAKTIAYTYNEPTVFAEYLCDCAKAARARGIGNVLISNGFIQEDPLKEIASLMTAIKIDLKAFSQNFYAETCSGKLKPVLDTLKRLAACGTWIEIVVLLIPTLNDKPEELAEMCRWIVRDVGADVPVHFTRYHPAYKIRNIPPTPPSTLETARKIASEAGCRFVYAGNMPGMAGEKTLCPKCGKLLIDRYGFTILGNNIRNGKCPACETVIPGVWT